jgi:hypothetical protein
MGNTGGKARREAHFLRACAYVRTYTMLIQKSSGPHDPRDP